MEKLRDVLNLNVDGLPEYIFSNLFPIFNEEKPGTILQNLNSRRSRQNIGGKAYVFLQSGKDHITVIERRKLFRKTYEVEEIAEEIKLEEIDKIDLGELYIPKLLLDAAHHPDSNPWDKGPWNLDIRNVIREARAEIRDEISDEECCSQWPKLLFLPQQFEFVQQAIVPRGGIDSRRLINLHMLFKECFSKMYEMNDFSPSGKDIWVCEDDRMMYPKVVVKDIKGDTETEISQYTIKELLNMFIEIRLEKNKMNATLILVYINYYFLYPVRMKRFSNTPKDTEM